MSVTRTINHVPSLITTIGFIVISIITSVAIYVAIGSLVDLLIPVKYNTKLLAKIIKSGTSFLISNKLRQTTQNYTMGERDQILTIALLSLINLISIAISQQHTNYAHIFIGVINMSVITISIFSITTVYDNNCPKYYIDNKLITAVYLLSVLLNNSIIAFIFNLLMLLKLISIYNSTYFIISNNVKQNYLYLFLIYLNVIDRYIDINQMLY